ncbi:MAG: IS630 family transposase [Planctomycetota bacterium]
MAEDEASLYLQATTMRTFAPVGQTPIVRVDPQRDKVSFYGTIDLETGRVIAHRSPKMNAEVTARHLQQILDAIPDRNILLLWDRAPWHHGAPIRQVLERNPRLEIMLFPVAAPDMNPQEHVWKATRRATSHNHIQKRLPDLADRFERHLTAKSFNSSFLVAYGFNTIRSRFT